jgi:WD40 repeat protein/serine/threonine protein kinase
MSTATRLCPDHELLERFLEETLTDVEQASVADHVGACPSCQESLDRLTTGSAISFASEHADAKTDAAAVDGAGNEFLSRLKQSSPGKDTASGSTDKAPSAWSWPELGPTGPETLIIPGYEVLRELGRGGMGVVYKARQLSLNRLVALKVLLAGPHAGVKDLVRFRQEAEAIAGLRHANFVQIYDIGEAEGRPFLALEYVEEGNLGRRLRGNPQPVAAAVALVETLARAVHFAHQHQIVHRDLKPANILLRRKSEIPQPKHEIRNSKSEVGSAGHASDFGSGISDFEPMVTDFGLAKRLDTDEKKTHSGDVVGTPSYMAPEQAAGHVGQIGPATDVYALGTIFYEVLTGRPPFKGEAPVDTLLQVLHEEPLKPSRLRPGLPRDLDTICLKCLAKDPARRYASAARLAEDLERFRQGRPIRARPVGLFERAWKWARHRPLTAALLVGFVLIALIGFGGITWQWRSAANAWADAEESRGQAALDREKAKAALYFSLIIEGQLQWQLNDSVSAEQTLARLVPSEGHKDRRGWEWHYLKGLFRADLFTLNHRQRGPGASVAYQPEGRWLVSVVGGHPPDQEGRHARVRFWDATSGAPLQACPCPPGVHRLAVRPDGQRIALGATDGTVLVWEAPTGKELLRTKLHDDAVMGIAFSSDGRTIATASWDHTVKIWDGDSGQVLHTLKGHGEQVQTVAFQPSANRLASAGWDMIIRVWDTDTGQEVQTLSGHKNKVYCLAFSPDGRLLASASSKGNIKIWEMATGRVIQSLTGNSGSVLSLTWGPDGRYLAYGGLDGTVRVWDVENNVGRITFRGHTAAVEAVCFSPDSQRLASVSPAQAAVKIWDLTRHPEQGTFARVGPGPDIEALAFRDGGKSLISITGGGKLQAWNTETAVLESEHKLEVSKVVVSPGRLASFDSQARRLAARSRDDARVAKIWDAATGAELLAFLGHELPITCLRFSGDGKLLVTCAGDTSRTGKPNEVRVWNAETGKLMINLPGKGQIFSAAFSPDGSWLALGAERGRVTLVRCESRPRVVRFRLHQASVVALAFDPEGRLLASAGQGEGALYLWDLDELAALGQEAPEPQHTLPAPNTLYDLAFSPDGKRLAGITRDLVKLWDVAGGHEVLTLRGAPQRHWDPPFNPRVAFSPDGSRLAGSNWDESISLWDAEDQSDEAKVERRQVARRNAADQRARFWHLQEAEHCLEHSNPAAARFHFQRLGNAPLSGPVQQRRERVAAKLQEGAGKDR